MTLTAVVLAAVLARPVVQDDPYAVPAEVKNLAFFAGEWTSTGSGNAGAGEAKITGKATCTMQMGRWYQWDTEDDMEGFGKMTGKFLVTYNSLKKMYEGIWFDSITPYSMRLFGTLKDGTLSMESEKVMIPEVGETQFRITYSKTSDKQIGLKIDMHVGGDYATVLTSTYTKKAGVW